MAQRENTPDFRRRAGDPSVGISWLSDENFCCPHFICSTCGRPVRHDSPGIVTWRYDRDEPYSSIEYRIKHKTPDCDRRDERHEGGHFWFWDDLEDVLDQLLFNTLGRTPPPSPKLHRQFDSVPPALVEPEHKPRAKRTARSGSETTQAQRWRILRRDGWKCQLCGMTAADDGVTLEVDHMQPASKGGSNDDDNLWALCRPCNQSKRDSLS